MDLIDLKQKQLNSWAAWAAVYSENITTDRGVNMWGTCEEKKITQVSIHFRSLNLNSTEDTFSTAKWMLFIKPESALNGMKHEKVGTRIEGK